MLAPRASNAFVCVRCELQLARRRIPAYARQTSCATFSTSARRSDGITELEEQLEPQKSELRIKKEPQPLNRIRRRKGHVIQETSARLGGLKRLGDEADILVLKEVAQKQREKLEDTVQQSELPEVPDINASLQQEAKDLTPAEFIETLNKLRRKSGADSNDPIYVTQAVFLKRQRYLLQGFTKQQLAQYYAVEKKIKQDRIGQDIVNRIKDETASGKALVTRTEWQPGVTPMKQRLPQLTAYKRSKAGVLRKKLLVDRILRDVWKVIPQEELEALGEIEIALKPWQLSLLMTGDKEPPALVRIGRERRAKLQVDHARYILRITADKTSAEYAAQDIEDALAVTVTSKLDLKPWIPMLEEAKVPLDQKLATLFTQDDFDMVTSNTRTSVQRMDNANTLVIRGRSSDDVNEAERMLIRLLPRKSHVIRTVDTHNFSKGDETISLLPVFSSEQLLNYTDRKKSLGRWAYPVSWRGLRNRDVEDQIDAPLLKSMLDSHGSDELISRTLLALRQTRNELSHAGHTQSRAGSPIYMAPDYTLLATFGQALFPCDQTGESALSATPTFKPTVPGLSNLLTDQRFTDFTRMKAPSLVYDFIATPGQQDIAPGTLLPVLRGRFRTNLETGKVETHKISLRIHNHTHTVPLPGQATDVQFSTVGQLVLHRNYRQESLTQWLEAVSDNIASGGRLTAPSLTLDIPRWTIPGQRSDARGLCPVTYQFSGITLRHAVTGNWQGDPMFFSAQQAGKMGARIGSLSLVTRKNESRLDTLLADDVRVQAFIRKAFGVVDCITEAAGHSEPLSRKLKTRSGAGSERKERRLENASVVMNEDRDSVEQPMFVRKVSASRQSHPGQSE